MFTLLMCNFDVTIKMDKKFTIGASGVLQNPEKIGKGYSNVVEPNNKKKPHC